MTIKLTQEYEDVGLKLPDCLRFKKLELGNLEQIKAIKQLKKEYYKRLEDLEELD